MLFIVISQVTMKGQIIVKERIIQVTGIISDEESNPVPNVSILSHKLKKGTTSEISGIFNIISLPDDTISFSALGYKDAVIIIPPDHSANQFTKDVTLLNDTIIIKDVFILPWKNYDEFKREVLAEKPIKPEIINMYDNIASIQASISSTYSYKVTSEAGYRYAMQQSANAIMARNQSPANYLLNPFAWAKFISGIKNGLLKNQKSNKPASTKAKIRKKKT
jgi:hypothetical protein